MEYRTETDILLEMVQQATDNGLINNTEGIITDLKDGKRTDNQYVLDLSTHAFILSQLEQYYKETHDNSNISTASGEALDNFGLFKGVSRFSAKPPMVELTLSLPLLESQDVTIPQGTTVVLAENMSDYGEYVLSETVTIPAGVESVTAFAENIVGGVNIPLPAHACVGIQGYTVTVDNMAEGTTGSNIEEDDDYRLRIISSESKFIRGSLSCLEDYLGHYVGIDSYNLIPRYNGIGTLKIICDAPPAMLSTISDDVYRDCMIVTDTPPLVERPTDETVSKLKVVATTKDEMNLSIEELSSLIMGQVVVFIEGGKNRNGLTRRGLGIGADFVPSQLIRYLLDNFDEVENCYLEIYLNGAYSPFNQVYSVPSNNVLKVDEVEVEYETV